MEIGILIAQHKVLWWQLFSAECVPLGNNLTCICTLVPRQKYNKDWALSFFKFVNKLIKA